MSLPVATSTPRRPHRKMAAASSRSASFNSEDSRDESNGYLTPIRPSKPIVWEQAPISPPITPSLVELAPYANSLYMTSLRRNVYADNWPRQMEIGGDYGVFDLARLYSFGYLPAFPPSAIPSYTAAEVWGGTPLIQMVLEAPHLYFTRHERGWGHRGARCGVVGCLFVGDACPTRTLALHYYLYHFDQLKVRAEMVLWLHACHWPSLDAELRSVVRSLSRDFEDLELHDCPSLSIKPLKKKKTHSLL